jgi:ATP-dependent helicase/nuclease subunit A
MDGFRESYNVIMSENGYFKMQGESPCFKVNVISASSMLKKEIGEQVKDAFDRKAFHEFLIGPMDGEEEKKIETAFAWEYPKKQELKSRSKWSVSQLKEEGMDQPLLVAEDDVKVSGRKNGILEENQTIEEKENQEAPVKNILVPEFLKEKQEEVKLTGAGRGTAIHKLMEELSFAAVETNGLPEEIDRLVREGKFPEEYVPSVPIGKMNRFFQSDLGKRLIKAEKENRIYKEAQFMIGVPMSEMEADVDSDELVLVQGIIDLYLEEEDGLVVLDYKTDYVEHGKEDVLVKRYQPQLLWYKRALEQMTGKKVKETLIYSFGVSKTLVVDKN